MVWWCGFKDRDTVTMDLKIETRKDVDSAREEQDTFASASARSLSLFREGLSGKIAIWAEALAAD